MVKALTRNKGEVITDNMGIPGVDWTTGYPLTSSGWSGGPYTLVNDYVAEDPADDFMPTDPTPTSRKAKGVVQTPPAQAPAAEPTQDCVTDTIVIDGKKYSKEELRSLLE